MSSMESKNNSKHFELLTEFVAKLQEAITPSLSESFSEETRKLRNLLILVSVLLILISVGMVKVTKTEIALGSAKAAFVFSPELVTASSAIVLFFAITYLLRCYAEWQLWLLSKLRGEIELQRIWAEVAQNVIAREELRREVTEDVYNLINSGSFGTRSTKLVEELRDLFEGDEASIDDQKNDLLLSFLRPAIAVRRMRIMLEVIFPAVLACVAIVVAVSE